MANAVGVLRLIAYAAVLVGDRVLDYLGVPLPPQMVAVSRARLQAFLVVHFVGNTMSSTLLKTSAFEVLVRGGGADAKTSLVFSKLHTGRVPSIDEVFRGIDVALGEGGR